MRDLDTGPEPVDDPEAFRAAWRQAARVHWKAALLALVVTAVLVLM